MTGVMLSTARPATISVAPVSGRRDVEEFVRFPESLHRGHAPWVPPLRSDERSLFDPRRNRAHGYCDFALWLARDETGTTVGRVAGIINRRYNESRSERTARFSHFECVERLDVADALLEAVRTWAARHGMQRVIGPVGFTDQDPEGFLVDGFQEGPSIASYCNFPWVVEYLTALGWTKGVDYVVYKVPVSATLPPVYERALARIQRQGRVRLVEFSRRNEMRPYIRPILELMNETFRDLTGYSALDEDELTDLARRYRFVIDPRYVKIALAGDAVIGFIIGMPDLTPGFRKAAGRLLPLGWLWLLRAGRERKRLDLLVGGIRESWRGRGVDVMLGAAIMRAASREGFAWLDSHHELEDNTSMRAEMEILGGTVYKRYRIFQRPV